MTTKKPSTAASDAEGLPEPFAFLEAAVKQHIDPGTTAESRLEAARRLTEMLRAVNGFSSFLSMERSKIMRQIKLHDGRNFTDVGPELGMAGHRASGVSRGASTRNRPKKKDTDTSAA